MKNVEKGNIFINFRKRKRADGASDSTILSFFQLSKRRHRENLTNLLWKKIRKWQTGAPLTRFYRILIEESVVVAPDR